MSNRTCRVQLAEWVALRRSLAAGRHMAVMPDNASTAAQVRPLLLASEGSLVAVTSQRRLGPLNAPRVEGEAAIPTTLDLSYQQLSDDVARTYRVPGLLPVTTFDIELVAAVRGIPWERADDDVNAAEAPLTPNHRTQARTHLVGEPATAAPFDGAEAAPTWLDGAAARYAQAPRDAEGRFTRAVEPRRPSR
ncbi:hypothetical protein [Streptomyces sp. PT12]|uniref:hypothetical protein n=1 Tax=Streptomyces sp. PT12 TaxID=1510197 RepID=UPI0011BEA67D|nr:hypothetical protein [Streptomyces sp. PT12]